jgi:hypothetical protein
MVTDSEVDIIKLTEDGQVTKRILREGAGTTPEKNNSVSGMTLTDSGLY